VFTLPGGATQVGEDWLDPAWRGARATDAADPWGSSRASTALPGLELPGGASLTATGGLQIGGLEWLGARVYDPAARGFLSVDPLAPVTGAAWAANPYSYAGNDPMHALDPLGLRPATDADLDAYAAANQSVMGHVSDWADDHAYLIAGAAIVVGVALMFTGIGGPVGLALLGTSGALLSGGVSIAQQKHEKGSVNWGEVGVQAASGFVGGVAGAGTGAYFAAKAAGAAAKRVGAVMAAGATEGGVSNGVSHALGPGEFTPQGLASSVGSGLVTGTVTSGVMIHQPKWLSFEEMNTFQNWVYKPGYMSETEMLHRSGDINGFHMGDFWSTDAPTSISQVRDEKALPLRWASDGKKSTQNTGFSATFAEGVPYYRGKAAHQVGADGDYRPGGTNQTYIPDGYLKGDLINSWPLAP